MILPTYERGLLPLPDGAQMPYLKLGSGAIPLVVIPGAGDGLTTVYDGAARLAWYFRRRARRYRKLLLSRRQPIPDGYTVEQHADDYIYAIEQLNWGPTIFECNSGGGPVGQWIAASRPDLVCGLILSVTLHRADEDTRAILQHWLTLAEQRRWTELNRSSIEYTFRPATVARYRPFFPLLHWMPSPRDPDRMARVFAGLLDVDTTPILPRIQCPTLVIGGEDDRVIDASIQREMAELIPNSMLKLYPGFGHGNDQENPDYEAQVAQFIDAVLPDCAARRD